MAKPKIIITIDTEVGEKAKFVKEGFEKYVLGKIGNEYWGVPKIVEVLKRFGFMGEFFIDVYEDAFFGEEKYAHLCQYLDKRGHGVQLHTHPSYVYDINRMNMYEYSLEEQIKIIREGNNRIEKWIGKLPIAHRAGNYGANNNTLLALRSNNISIDSSFYYRHPNCKIKLKTINDPLVYKQIIEIPVSVNICYKDFFHMFPFFHIHPNKFDINTMDSNSMKNRILSYSSNILIIFLHSSSFIKRDINSTSVLGINKFAFENFLSIMNFFSLNNYALTVR